MKNPLLIDFCGVFQSPLYKTVLSGMFEWFFGNPKKKELKDFNWLEKQLSKTPTSQKELEKIFSEIKSVIKDLNKASLKLYLKDEDIIKKCEKLDVKILQHKPVKEIENNLKSYESSLRKHLENILEAIEIAKAEKGFPKQIFNNFKELIKDDFEGISEIMEELIKIYDFLKHIHLSPEEVEFWTMRKRGRTHIFPEVEIYLNSNLRHILIKKNDEVKKYKIIGSETAPNNWNKHIKKLLGLPYRNGEAQFCESVSRWQEVHHYEEIAVKNFKGKFKSANNQFNLFYKFSNYIGITDVHNTGNWKKTKIISVWFKREGNNYVYHGFPADPDEIEIENLE